VRDAIGQCLDHIWLIPSRRLAHSPENFVHLPVRAEGGKIRGVISLHTNIVPVRHEGLCLERTGWSISFENEDISLPSDWHICQQWHTVIVHLGGYMDGLETELDGHGGSSGPAQAGEMWTVPAGRRYAASGRGGLIRYAVIAVDPECQEGRSEAHAGSWELAARAGVRDEGLHFLVRGLEKSLAQRASWSSLKAAEFAHRVLAQLHRRHGAGTPAGNRKAAGAPVLSIPVVRRLRRWIRERLAETLRLEDLASEAGVSVHQLLIGFRQAFGTTPAQYVIRQRLRAARHLLVTTQKDITTIALETGFSSHSHLTRAFGKEAGRPPSQFRSDWIGVTG